MRQHGWMAAVLAAWGCGGPGSVEGTVAGHGLEVADAVFFAASNEPKIALVVLASREQACPPLSRGARLRDTTWLRFTLQSQPAGMLGPLDAGEYAVAERGERTAFNVEFRRADASCGGIPASASAGAVELEEMEPRVRAAGRFALDFDGQKVEGDFRATWCGEELPVLSGACE